MDLLPPNATNLERALVGAIAAALDLEEPVSALWDPDRCPASHLPWLAWQFSVDGWDPTWTESQKRAAIRASFEVHRYKGTRYAVERALAALGYSTHLIEWFQEAPPAAPGTFAVEVDLDDRGISAELYDQVERLALATKNARSHLTRVSIVGRFPCALRVHGATVAAEVVEVLPYSLAELQTGAGVRVGCAVVCHETVTLYPQVSA